MKRRGIERMPWGFILFLWISACQATPLPAAATVTPTGTATATATLIPLIRPTVTPTPVRLGIDVPIKVSSLGETVSLSIVAASESMKILDPRTNLFFIEPMEGDKLILVDYEASSCPFIEPVLMDENQQGYREGYSDPEDDTHTIPSDNCLFWIFGVPSESEHFTLFVPSGTGSEKYYKIDLDEVLTRLEGFEEEVVYPPAPFNCTAEALSASEVKVSWEMPADRTDYTGFHIYDGARQPVFEYTIPGDARNVQISNLLPNTQYYFEVMAWNNEISESSQSCTVQVTTLP